MKTYLSIKKNYQLRCDQNVLKDEIRGFLLSYYDSMCRNNTNNSDCLLRDNDIDFTISIVKEPCKLLIQYSFNDCVATSISIIFEDSVSNVTITTKSKPTITEKVHNDNLFNFIQTLNEQTLIAIF